MPVSNILDGASTILEVSIFRAEIALLRMDINHRLAHRILQMRAERGMSIEELAGRSGVSRGMISRIERAESSATATVLAKLASGFGVLLPELFGPFSFADAHLGNRNPVSSRRGQPLWKDPATGCRRRRLTPATSRQSLKLEEIHLPEGRHVMLDICPAGHLVQQQLWLLEGRLDVQLGANTTRLVAGDCMAVTLDRPATFHNPGDRDTRYLVATLGNTG